MIRYDAFSLTPDARELTARLGAAPEGTLRDEVEESLHALRTVCECRCTWREVPVIWGDECVDLGFGPIPSRGLSHNLTGCSRAYLFAATLGHGADRLLRDLSLGAPSRHFVTDAVASALIEALCDRAQSELPCPTLPRFSAGYGDFPLSCQCDLLNVLHAGTELGISLTDSFFMFPTKSVTAVIGIPEADSDRKASV